MPILSTISQKRNPKPLKEIPWPSLVVEAGLFVLLVYIVLIGGSFRGQIIYSISVTNIIVTSGVGVIWFIWRITRRRAFPKTRLDLPILAAIAAYLLATVFSSDPRRSLIIFPQIIVPFAAYYFFVDLFNTKLTAGPLRRAIVYSSIIPILLGLLQIWFWYQSWLDVAGWSDPIPAMTTRVTMGLGHANTGAAYLVLLIPLGIAGLFLRRKFSDRLVIVTWIVGIFLCLFFTSSRGGWLAAVAELALMAVLLFSGKAREALGAVQQIIRKPAKAAVLGIGVIGAIALTGRVALWQMDHPSHVPLMNSRGYIWGPAIGAFVNDVFTGNGPSTFGSVFLTKFQIPIGMLLVHAHNFYLNVLAECGLVGIAALLFFGAAIIMSAWTAWKNSRGDERIILIACISGLAGLAVHSLTDTPENTSFNTIIAAAFLAQITVLEPKTGEGIKPAIGFIRMGALGTALVGSLAIGTMLYYPYYQGIKAAQNESWQDAAEWFDQAAEQDPSFAVNWLEAGFTHGMAGLNADGTVKDQAELDAAIFAYERGVAIEGLYSTNWADLAALRWAGGDRKAAIQDMEKVVDMSPSVVAFRATLGRMYEATGDETKAREEYEAALSLAPFLAESDFFEATALRAETSSTWQQEHVSGMEAFAVEIPAGWTALDEGRSAEALTIFESVRLAEGYLGAGLAYLQSGEPAKAETAFRVALFVNGNDGWIGVWIHQGLAEALAQQGKTSESAEHADQAKTILENTGAYGPNRYTNDQYGESMFSRVMVAADLLPGIDRVFDVKILDE